MQRWGNIMGINQKIIGLLGSLKFHQQYLWKNPICAVDSTFTILFILGMLYKLSEQFFDIKVSFKKKVKNETQKKEVKVLDQNNIDPQVNQIIKAFKTN